MNSGSLSRSRRRIERRRGDRAGEERVELVDGDADVALWRGVALLDAFAEIGDFVVDEFGELTPARESVFARVVGADGLDGDEVAVLHLPGVHELADGPEFVAARAEGDRAF